MLARGFVANDFFSHSVEFQLQFLSLKLLGAQMSLTFCTISNNCSSGFVYTVFKIVKYELSFSLNGHNLRPK